MRHPFSLEEIEALIIDIDGTLFRGSVPLPGIKALFTFLQAKKMPFTLATNNATKAAAEYQDKLEEIGVQVDAGQIVTAAVATANYLAGELGKGTRIYVIGEPALRDELCQAGFDLLDDASQPADAVVVGGDSTLTYEKLKFAALLLQRGARFVGTNPDLLYPTEEGLVPETGTTLAALQAATGISPRVIGKPERYLFDMALAKMDCERSRTLVLGDRLETDIGGGQRAELKTALVTTGVDNRKSILDKGIEPDLVVDGLETLVKLWKTASR
jgi:4-nitrophenyl phosphatase